VDWRKYTTTPHCDDGDRIFKVTHPFHPLFGTTFELVIYRNNWGEDRIFFHNAQGRLISLPAKWTNVIGEDPFVAISAGRSHFRVEDLVKLARLLKGLQE